MSARLSVRLSGAFGERNITNELMDLSYRSEGNGGFKSASFRLARPIHREAPELAAMNRVYVYDARSPRKVAWQGYLEDPGRAADSSGLVWTVNAVGPFSRLNDRASSIVYVDRRVDAWRRGDTNTSAGPKTKPNLNTDQDQPDDSDQPGWRLRLENGTLVAIGDCGAIIYSLIQSAGQHVARVHFDYVAGTTDSAFRLQIGHTGGGAYTTDKDVGFTTVAGTLDAKITTDITTTRDITWIVIHRNTSTITPTTDLTNEFINNLSIRGTLMTKSGTEKTAAANYANTYVLASEVVEDIVGRWGATIDGINANIVTTSFAIEQLAYTDPVRPLGLLEDIADLEPDYRYAVWGETYSGKNEFEYVRWDDGDILEATPVDGYSSPESSSDMYSEVNVRFNDGTGKIRSAKYTQNVPALQGIPRTEILDLGSEKGVTLTQVAQAGAAFLAEHNTPSNSGSLVVARPIQNITRGVMVDPHMIRPGTLLRLRGVQARPDYLNAIDHNGVTMFRVVATEYSQSSGAATLELENFNPSLARQLAEAKRTQDKLRRN